MDQTGDTGAERSLALTFTIDFDTMNVIYEGGFHAPIVEMYDRFDMETDDPKEAEELIIAYPPDGLFACILVEDLCSQEVAVPDKPH
jgi:hypothetical protein